MYMFSYLVSNNSNISILLINTDRHFKVVLAIGYVRKKGIKHEPRGDIGRETRRAREHVGHEAREA